jgi:hypothetical protein
MHLPGSSPSAVVLLFCVLIHEDKSADLCLMAGPHFIFFFSDGTGTQGLVHARQMLDKPLSYNPQPLVF